MKPVRLLIKRQTAIQNTATLQTPYIKPPYIIVGATLYTVVRSDQFCGMFR